MSGGLTDHARPLECGAIEPKNTHAPKEATWPRFSLPAQRAFWAATF